MRKRLRKARKKGGDIKNRPRIKSDGFLIETNYVPPMSKDEGSKMEYYAFFENASDRGEFNAFPRSAGTVSRG